MNSKFNNLPWQLSSFIGREREIAEIKRLLASSRLVTLTGAGGCGKTRLALEIAAQVLDTYADGVWLIDLAPLSDASLVPYRLASVLDVREQPSQPILETLANYLRNKTQLLVLDNCEHLVEACALMVESLLQACPQLTILVTTREALGLRGEMTLFVPSLSVPPVALSATNLQQYEAAQLFIERAVAAQLRFTLSEQNAIAIAQICQRLDGIPLALELAAARVNALSVEQIAARLDAVFALQMSGSRTALPRHQTLRTTIDWSYGLLSEHERMLFRRLSVFVGGWTVEAAESVCNGQGIDTPQVLELLIQLVNKSLVTAEEREGAMRDPAVPHRPQTGDSLRYRLLETIRHYAHERLQAAGEDSLLRRQHLAFYLRFAEDTEPRLHDPEQLHWYNRLGIEHDNLRAAIDWSLVEGDVDAGLRLAGALRDFWYTRGYWSEGRERLTSLLAQPEAAHVAHTPVRAKALTAAGYMAFSTGRFHEARVLHEEAIALWRKLGNQGRLSASLATLGRLMIEQDFAVAQTLLDEALIVGQQSGDQYAIGWTLHYHGTLALNQGDFAAACKLFEESMAIFGAMEDRLSYAMPLGNLATTLFRMGQYPAAQARMVEALPIYREIGDRRHTANMLHMLAEVARKQNDFAAAQTLYMQGLLIRRELGTKQAIAYSLEGLGHLATALGEGTQAARLFGAAQALLEDVGAPIVIYLDQAEHEQSVAAVNAQLGAATFAAAFAQGRGLTMEQALQEAERLFLPPRPEAAPATSPDGSPQGYPAGLTEREVEILRLVAMGLNNPEIAEQLVISVRTVNAHLRSIFNKLDVTSRTAAARYAIEYKLV